mmetsp:Transcript_83494/g.145130  ORF Transcript_83494/g.145130 Transcript_83494/m.145130 type:complete len:177 (-) Transcript_83494:148-678(-)
MSLCNAVLASILINTAADLALVRQHRTLDQAPINPGAPGRAEPVLQHAVVSSNASASMSRSPLPAGSSLAAAKVESPQAEVTGLETLSVLDGLQRGLQHHRALVADVASRFMRGCRETPLLYLLAILLGTLIAGLIVTIVGYVFWKAAKIVNRKDRMRAAEFHRSVLRQSQTRRAA